MESTIKTLKSKQLGSNICVGVVRSIPVIIILCILSWSYYAYVYHLCLSHIVPTEIKEPYLIVYHAILILFLWSYIKTIFTESDDAPSKFRLSKEAINYINRNPIDLAKKNSVLRNFAKNLPIMTLTNTDSVRFCDKCRIVKPDRSHHCSVCRKCVLKMDHHCPWINNCVSYANHKYFILFLVYGLLMCIYVVATTGMYVAKLWNDQPEQNLILWTALGESFKLHILSLFFIGVIVSMFFFSFIAFHIYLVLKNKTTLESFHPPKFSESCEINGFNLGCCRNIEEVFGKEIILWPFPINTKLGDGVSFPLSNDLRYNEKSKSYII